MCEGSRWHQWAQAWCGTWETKVVALVLSQHLIIIIVNVNIIIIAKSMMIITTIIIKILLLLLSMINSLSTSCWARYADL